MNLGKLYSLSEIQLLHLKNGDHHTYLIGLWGDLKGLHAYMVSYQRLVYRKHLMLLVSSPCLKPYIQCVYYRMI